MTKETWEEMGYLFFGFYFQSIAHHQRKSRRELKQRRTLKAGADPEAMEGYYLLAYYPPLLRLLC